MIGTKTAAGLSAGFVLILAGFSMGVAQSGKPYTEWNEREARKILDDSPWGQTQVWSDTSRMFQTGRGRASNQTQDSSADHVNFRIRFLSARPVRQATSRVIEMQQKGPLPEQLAAQLKAFAAADFPDYIVVTLTVDTLGREAKEQLQTAASLLQTLTTAELKNNTYLLRRGGERVFLKEYQTPKKDGLGARLIFPRLVNGEPFANAESGEILFHCELKDALTLNMRYKTKDMIYDGKFEY